MTPKEKAEELIGKFTKLDIEVFGEFDGYLTMKNHDAKECALIAVDEIIKTLNEDIRDLDVRGNVLLDLIEYWREVKQEIEKL